MKEFPRRRRIAELLCIAACCSLGIAACSNVKPETTTQTSALAPAGESKDLQTKLESLRVEVAEQKKAIDALSDDVANLKAALATEQAETTRLRSAMEK